MDNRERGLDEEAPPQVGHQPEVLLRGGVVAARARKEQVVVIPQQRDEDDAVEAEHRPEARPHPRIVLRPL